MRDLESLVSPSMSQETSTSTVLRRRSLLGEDLSTRIDGGSIETSFVGTRHLNVSNIYIHGDMIWHGIPIGFQSPTTAPSSAPTIAPSSAPTVSLGGSSSRPAASCADVKSALGTSAADEFRWILAPGMVAPTQVWCDQTREGGGWSRFWWHGTLEINGAAPPAFPQGDVLGNELSTIPHLAATGFGRIPSGAAPTQLLVVGSGATQPAALPLGYAVFTFDSTATSSAIKASLQSGAEYRSGVGGDWPPAGYSAPGDVAQVGTLRVPAYTRSVNYNYPMFDAWYYDDTHAGQGGKSFYFDDDTGWYNTVFAAGRDGSGGDSGVDFFSGVNDPNSPDNNLVLYWR